MKKILFTLLIAYLYVGSSKGQEFDVPTYYSFDKAEDYAAYTPMIVECIEWLIATPVNKEQDKRMDCHAFLFGWLIGTPEVSIGLDGEIVTFADDGDLFLIFMAGWAKDTLLKKDQNPVLKVKNQKEQELVEGNMAGLRAVMELYQNNKAHLATNEEIEKYMQMEQKRTLEKFVRRKVRDSMKKTKKSV